MRLAPVGADLGFLSGMVSVRPGGAEVLLPASAQVATVVFLSCGNLGCSCEAFLW